MAHIKLKNITEKLLPENLIERLKGTENFASPFSKNKFTDSLEEFGSYVIEDKELIATFHKKINNTIYILKEIHPICIQISIAYENFKLLPKIKKSNISNTQVVNDTNFNFAHYLWHSNVLITSLHTAIEGLVNLIISNAESINYKCKNGKNRTKEYCLRYLDFDEKISFALPYFFDKSFKNTYPIEFEITKGVKKLRDQIIHIKPTRDQHGNFYRELYIQFLEFNFDEAISASILFINFHSPNLIELCNCNNAQNSPS